jgi:uncharacterized protein (AIM24 family)
LERCIMTSLFPHSSTQEESFGGVRYQTTGEHGTLVQIDLGSSLITFDATFLFCRDPGIWISAETFWQELFSSKRWARGPGKMTLRAKGRVVPLRLAAAQQIEVLSQQTMAYTERILKTSGIFSGKKESYYASSEGVLWLFGYGDVVEARLQPGEHLDIEPDSWLYKDASVCMQKIYEPKNLFGVREMLRFVGPGRVGLHSPPPKPEVHWHHSSVHVHHRRHKHHRREPRMGFPKKQPW